MSLPSPVALPPPAPPTELPLDDPQAIALALVALILAGLFALVRSALGHAVPARVLAHAKDDATRARLAPLLERADKLRTTASAYTIAAQVVFLVLVRDLVTGERFTWARLALSLVVIVPLLVFVCELLPQALRGPRHDALLVRFLPGLRLLHMPVAAPIHALEATRRFTMRLLRIKERPRAARAIVEGLRDVVEGSELEGDLGDTAKEIIENAMEFHDVDVAEVMTPRTEMRAVEVGAGLAEVARLVAESGHGRLPVYDGTLDSIIGVVSSHDVIRALEEHGTLAGVGIREVMRPTAFVPETKLISELLSEFRRDKQKLAVVLDEYGGTSGLVTMTDILAEIVGDLGDEHDPEEADDVARHEDGSADVAASLRISEVNEELGLSLSEEEDYETLAGFVLARLGRFPKVGEAFVADDVEYTVIEANDRRVLRVRIRRLSPQPA